MQVIKKYGELIQLILAVLVILDLSARIMSKPSELRAEVVEKRLKAVEDAVQKLPALIEKQSHNDRRLDILEGDCKELKDEINTKINRIYKILIDKSGKIKNE